MRRIPGTVAVVAFSVLSLGAAQADGTGRSSTSSVRPATGLKGSESGLLPP